MPEYASQLLGHSNFLMLSYYCGTLEILNHNISIFLGFSLLSMAAMVALRQFSGGQFALTSPTFNKKSFSELFVNLVSSKPALKVNAKMSSHRGEG